MADYGLLKFKFATGVVLKVRGSVTESGTNLSAEAIVHHDNTFDRSLTAKAYTFSVSFAARDADNRPINIDAIMRAAPMDITLISDAEKASRTFTRAQATGEPSIDLMTGEVTGLAFTAQDRVVVNV